MIEVLGALGAAALVQRAAAVQAFDRLAVRDHRRHDDVALVARSKRHYLSGYAPTQLKSRGTRFSHIFDPPKENALLIAWFVKIPTWHTSTESLNPSPSYWSDDSLMSEESSFHPDAFHNARSSHVVCSGCHLPVPSFLAGSNSRHGSQYRLKTGELSITDSAGTETYSFYNECRHQLLEIADLLSSPRGCPSCGSSEPDLSVEVSINPGPGFDGKYRVSTAVCESCAESLHARQSNPPTFDDGRKYCIPQWLSTPPWKRDYRTFTSDELSPTAVAPSPPITTSSSTEDPDIGVGEAGSFEVRKAFHELIEGCRVTLGVIEYTSEPRPLQFLSVRGVVESIDRSANPPQINLSVGDVDGSIHKSERFGPDRVLLFGTPRDKLSGRGAEQYRAIEATVETWHSQSTRSPHFEKLFDGYVTGLEYQTPSKHEYTVPDRVPVEEYPAEPNPPKTVTSLSTIYFDNGRLSADLDASENQWIAQLTGRSEKYDFSKDWIVYARPGRDDDIVSGAADLSEGAFIEIGWDSEQQFIPPESEFSSIGDNPYKIRRYFRVEDGCLVEYKREEVKEEIQ